MPDPASDASRVGSFNNAKQEKWIIVQGSCTHLGCVPVKNSGDYNGWYCPCHGSHYTTAARIRAKVPRRRNLVVPEFAFLSESAVRTHRHALRSLNPAQKIPGPEKPGQGQIPYRTRTLRPQVSGQPSGCMPAPIVGLMHDSFVSYPTPRNLNYFWTFGGISRSCSACRSSPASCGDAL